MWMVSLMMHCSHGWNLRANTAPCPFPFSKKAIVSDYIDHVCKKAMDNGDDYDTTKSRLELDTKYNSTVQAVFDYDKSFLPQFDYDVVAIVNSSYDLM